MTLRIVLFNTAHRWVGEAAATDQLARVLLERGHDVTVIMPQIGKVQKTLMQAPYPAIRVPWRVSAQYSASPVNQYSAVAKVLKELQPQIIHVGRGKEHWCAAFLRRFCCPQARIVRTRHVVLPMRQSTMNQWLFRSGTDAVTAVSHAAFRGLGSLGDHLPFERRHVVLGAVNLRSFSSVRRNEALRRELGCTTGNELLVGLVGRWQRVKGHDVFHEAMSDVMRRIPDTRAVVAGRKVSMEHPRLREFHEKSGMGDRIQYLGMLKDPAELVASLDIGVIASRGSEGFSRIAVEYMASGVPVVATRVGALPEILCEGELGLLVPPENPAALAAGICQLIHDAPLRRNLAVAAKNDTEARFSLDRMVNEMEEVYAAAMDASLQD